MIGMKDLFVLNHDIKVYERKLDWVNDRIAKIKKQKSPIRNLKLILPFVISLFFLIFPRLAGDYCHKTIVEANARGIHNVDLGIFNNSYIQWLFIDVPRLHSITLILIIIAAYCSIRLFGRYGHTKSGILPSKIAGFFGDINYNNELSSARKEYFQIKKELANLRLEKESIENPVKSEE